MGVKSLRSVTKNRTILNYFLRKQDRPFSLLRERSIVFREVKYSDINTLHQYCWPEQSINDVQALIDRVLTLQQKQRGSGLVAIVDNEISGFSLLTQWPTVAEISDLIVTESKRGQGIGTAIIESLTQIACQWNIKTLEIGAMTSNKGALRLYQNLGFEINRTITVHIASKPQNIIYLQKSLG